MFDSMTEAEVLNQAPDAEYMAQIRAMIHSIFSVIAYHEPFHHFHSKQGVGVVDPRNIPVTSIVNPDDYANRQLIHNWRFIAPYSLGISTAKPHYYSEFNESIPFAKLAEIEAPTYQIRGMRYIRSAVD
jgi:hypothetical protein